ncbi:uncharacterized protein LOC125678665 isoform X2 [Ostrea edulis]|uniref:uncharacterized protein LOC125678665 isoform X2 n=1 Tax=Ostrea edulis TaxID=37623 RepID=UPI0024AF60F9|nr:uncharacterized protein LOC125678665 isoform X2 [Ostrea edulis]
MTYVGIGAFLIFLLLVNPSEPKKNVFCKPRRHEHYIEQFGQCKKCDRCPLGWGYGIGDSKNEVDMDPVHGATSCQRCMQCISGVSFSKFIGYMPCRKCKNCSTIGKVEIRSCTTKRNSKCGGPFPPPKSQEMSQDIPKEGPVQNEDKQHTSHQLNTGEDLVNFKSVFLWTIAVCMLIATFLITTFYILRRKKSVKKDVHKVEEIPLSICGGEDNEVMTETTSLTQDNTGQRELVQNHTGQRELVQNHTGQRELVQNNTGQRELVQNNTGRELVQNHTGQRELVQNHTGQRKLVQNHTGQRELVQDNIEQRELMQDKGEQPTTHIRNFATQSVQSLESDFHYELKTISPVEEDGVSTAERLQTAGPHVHIRDSISIGDMLTDAQIQNLCPELAAGNTYRRLGRMLGVRDNDIEIIREENRDDPKEAAFQTLKKWREVKGQEATKRRLREALRHADRQDLADKIK